MAFDRDMFPSRKSGFLIDTMQSLRLYYCDTLEKIDFKNITLENPMLAENDVYGEVPHSHSDQGLMNSSVQMFHIFNHTDPRLYVQIEITPLKPNKRFEMFVRHKEKPIDTKYDWKGEIPMESELTEHSEILSKEITKHIGIYYVLVHVNGELFTHIKLL